MTAIPYAIAHLDTAAMATCLNTVQTGLIACCIQTYSIGIQPKCPVRHATFDKCVPAAATCIEKIQKIVEIYDSCDDRLLKQKIIWIMGPTNAVRLIKNPVTSFRS